MSKPKKRESFKELVIYADESMDRGPFFSNFYGGAAVRSTHIDDVRSHLNRRKEELNLFGEVKWQKVTRQYLDKYVAFIDGFFDLIEQDMVKVRIMFTSNQYIALGLTHEHREMEYFLLYYQFIKHAFGLEYAPVEGDRFSLRLYFDKLPDSDEKAQRFIGFIRGLERQPQFRDAGIVIPKDQVAEVSSHDHVVMQALDIVLGAIQFRLNDKHLKKPAGSRTRGGKTIAKHELYKHINSRIRQIYPGFNIGISTGRKGMPENVWLHPYRHWLFVPSNNRYDPSKAK